MGSTTTAVASRVTRSRAVHRERAGIAALIVGLGAILGFTILSDDQYSLHVLIWIALSSLLAVCMRFVLLVGEKNIATAAFYGLGAYCSAIITVTFEFPFAVALIAAGAIAACGSAVFGLVTFRTKGPYFMLVSFALTEFMRLVYTRIEAIGGASGMVGIFAPAWLEPWMPAFTVSVVAALILLLYLCERSNLGKIFKAIGDNDSVVSSVGISVFRIKLLCLVLASFAVGIGGALQAHTTNIVSPADFGYAVVVYAFAYVKVGGQSHVLGSVLGATVLILLVQLLQGSGSLELIIFGAAIVLSMLFLPNGLIGLAGTLAGQAVRYGRMLAAKGPRALRQRLQ